MEPPKQRVSGFAGENKLRSRQEDRQGWEGFCPGRAAACWRQSCALGAPAQNGGVRRPASTPPLHYVSKSRLSVQC